MVREPALAEVTFGGDVYGIPEFNVVQITQASSSVMKQAGVTIEDVNGSDWDAVSEANKAMAESKNGKVSVIGFDRDAGVPPLWVHANGGAMISDDGRTAQLDRPEVIEALEWAAEIYDDQGWFGKTRPTGTRPTSSATWHWELIVTASIITTVAMIVVFLLGQRQIVEGIATTGSKG